MTTDSRLAPLAAALKVAFTEKPYKYADGHVAPVLRDDAAAAILAALPDDWCGHGAEALDREAFIGRQQAEIASLRDDLAHCERAWEDAGNEIARLREDLRVANTQLDNWVEFAAAKNAEIPRLRAIEKAARYARAVATIWLDAYQMKGVERGAEAPWFIGAHPLALVLAALDGEMEARNLGLDDATLRDALGSER